MSKPKTIMIDAQEYIRREDIKQEATQVDGMNYCVIRTYSAGVHIGYVKRHEGQEVELINSRRLWSWDKASSLSQVAIDGCTSERFAIELPNIILTDVIEIIQCTQKAKDVLGEIVVWKS